MLAAGRVGKEEKFLLEFGKPDHTKQLHETFKTIALRFPQKTKPVTKAEALRALNMINVLHNKYDHITELIERVEKVGFE